jgi:hypothetical protein
MREELDKLLDSLVSHYPAFKTDRYGPVPIHSEQTMSARTAIHDLVRRLTSARGTADAAFYALTVQQRDAAWLEIERLKAENATLHHDLEAERQEVDFLKKSIDLCKDAADAMFNTHEKDREIVYKARDDMREERDALKKELDSVNHRYNQRGAVIGELRDEIERCKRALTAHQSSPRRMSERAETDPQADAAGGPPTLALAARKARQQESRRRRRSDGSQHDRPGRADPRSLRRRPVSEALQRAAAHAPPQDEDATVSQRIPIEEALGQEFELILIPGHDGESFRVATGSDLTNYFGPLLIAPARGLPFWAADHPKQRASCVPNPTLDEIKGHSAAWGGAGDQEAWLKGPRFQCRTLRVKLVALEEVPAPLPPTPLVRPAPEHSHAELPAKPKDPTSKLNDSYLGNWTSSPEPDA